VQLTDVDELVLLFVFDQAQFQPMGVFLDFVVGTLEIEVHLLVLIGSCYLFIIDFTVVLVLVGHIFHFCLDFFQLLVLVFDVALTLCHVLLEFDVEIDEHVLPVDHVLQGI